MNRLIYPVIAVFVAVVLFACSATVKDTPPPSDSKPYVEVRPNVDVTCWDFGQWGTCLPNRDFRP